MALILRSVCIIIFIGLTSGNHNVKLDWAVEIDGDETIAFKIAQEKNFKFLGPVGNLDNIFHFQKTIHSNQRSSSVVESHTQDLKSHKSIQNAHFQVNLKRKKHNIFKNEDKEKRHFNRLIERRHVLNMFNDPQWSEQWYLFDSRLGHETNPFDLQVLPVWKMNITGKGVKLTIIDDGLEHNHPDIINNYDPLCSTDLNDDDDDPTPNTSPGTSNEHGTRCASEIVMGANNGLCGVGLAYNAKIGGIRILDGVVNDLIEAKSLGYHNNYIDIYSSSWGPLDDGKTMEKAGPLVAMALKKGTEKGRYGKGNIYVWASGNGGYLNDCCNADGYVSSQYVISVNSILPDNSSPDYGEDCPSSMCSTYSSSFNLKSRLITADVRGKCTDKHGGTSASAPYAAGIFALVLEMNPNLTWRDIRHLITWTSENKNLISQTKWKKNNAGFWVNLRFGFGLLNAYKMVTMAKHWKTVPPLSECSYKSVKGGEISNYKSQKLFIHGFHCSNHIKFIENIIVLLSANYTSRGALGITLQSPYGMNTTILSSREHDNDKSGFDEWPLNTVHNWGESPRGTWIVYVEDKRLDNIERMGYVSHVKLHFYGTKELPHHIKEAPGQQRTY